MTTALILGGFVVAVLVIGAVLEVLFSGPGPLRR